MNKMIRNLISLIILPLIISLNAWSQDSEGIKILRRNGQLNVNIPTFQGQTPSVIVNESKGSLFFATGAAAQNLSHQRDHSRSNQPTLESTNLISLSLSQIIPVKFKQGSIAAGIYPVISVPQTWATALHVLLRSPDLLEKEIWYGFLDENNQLLDIAVTSKQFNIESLGQFFYQLPQSDIGRPIQIPHLSIIQNTDDLTLSRSTSQIIAQSNKYFYFKNSSTSHVGPQSSGAVVYDLNSNQPLGVVSCLSKVESTGPGNELVRAISFKQLLQYQMIRLTPDAVSHFKSNCEPYDSKRGGGD